MNFDDLNAFITVARLRGFSAAAAHLRVAQSSLSKRVQRLEQHFGVALLIRHARGVTLTEPGALLLERAERLVGELEGVERDVRTAFDQVVGEVCVAIPPSTSPVLAPLIFDECLLKYPGLRLQLRESTSDTIHHWLSRGEVDLAVMYNAEPSAQLTIRELVLEPLYLIGPVRDPLTSRELTYSENISLRNLAELPLVLPPRPHSIRVLIERLCAAEGVRPNIQYEIDSIRTTRHIITRTPGYTVFSRTWLADDIAEGRLRAVPFASALVNWKLGVAHDSAQGTSVALLGVRSIIEKKLRELFERGLWRGSRWIGDGPEHQPRA